MTTHSDAVRSFDHTRLAAMPSYGALRKALADFANQASSSRALDFDEFLDAVRDMALTIPYVDCCDCSNGRNGRPTEMTWPHAVQREPDGWLKCRYRCQDGHVWTCGYSVSFPELMD